MQWSLLLLVLMGHCCCVVSHKKYHYITEERSWDDAQKYCKERFTDLATVYDMKDVKTLCDSAAIQGNAWIGLRRDPKDIRTWHWSLQGVKVQENELKWSKDEPNDKGKPENCVTIKKKNEEDEKVMQDYPCTKKFKFICYNEKEQSGARLYVSTEEKTWLQAQRYCRSCHTDLISEPQLLDQVNLTSAKKEDRFWIGLFRDRWKWSSLEGASFRNWAPNNYTESGDKNCAVTRRNGKWQPADCDNRNFFFCYNYSMILIKENMSWDKALEYCREHHNDLVSIITAEDQKWVQDKAKQATSSHVWLGLRYVHILDFWFWVSNQAIEFENWAQNGDPGDHSMSGAMERGGEHKWFKKDDEEEFNFICSTL